MIYAYKVILLLNKSILFTSYTQIEGALAGILYLIFLLSFFFANNSFFHKMINEEKGNSPNNHDDAPKLAWGESWDKFASMVIPKEFDYESPNSIGYQVNTHVVFEINLKR